MPHIGAAAKCIPLRLTAVPVTVLVMASASMGPGSATAGSVETGIGAAGPAHSGTTASGPRDSGPPDYAPSGVPDFSQCRSAWSRAGTPAQWTHAGPVAAANALWWLDSVAEPQPLPPPAVSDGHGLVTAYPRFGPPYDDHDSANLHTLVDDLASRADTSGVRTGGTHHGTEWEDLTAAMQGYVESRRLESEWRVVTADAWDADRAQDGLAHGGAVVALLGVWERQSDRWARVGGHYATVVDVVVPGGGAVLLADPLADRTDLPGGHHVPADPAMHSCREAPAAHDDAAVVSHDRYELSTVLDLPGGRPVLERYFQPETYGEAAAFAGQNAAAFLADHAAAWGRGLVVMAMDGLLVIEPAVAPTATPTATDQPTAPATPTESPAPTGSAISTPSTSPTGSATQRAPTSTTPPTWGGAGLFLPLILRGR